MTDNSNIKAIKNDKQKNRKNLLTVFKAINTIICICYAIAAFVVCIKSNTIEVFLYFLFGTIPLALLFLLPYYFAKVFVDVAEDIHTLVERMPPVETHEEQSQPQNDLSAENEE